MKTHIDADHYQQHADYQFASLQIAQGKQNKKLFLKNGTYATGGRFKCVSKTENTKAQHLFFSNLKEFYGEEIAAEIKKSLAGDFTPASIKAAFDRAHEISKEKDALNRPKTEDDSVEFDVPSEKSSKENVDISIRHISPQRAFRSHHSRIGSEVSSPLPNFSNAQYLDARKASFLIFLKDDHVQAWEELMESSPKLMEKLKDHSFLQKWTRYFSNDVTNPFAIDRASPTRTWAREKVLSRVKEEIIKESTASLDDIIVHAVEEQIKHLHDRDELLVKETNAIDSSSFYAGNAWALIRYVCNEVFDEDMRKDIDAYFNEASSEFGKMEKAQSILGTMERELLLTKGEFEKEDNYDSKFVNLADDLTLMFRKENTPKNRGHENGGQAS